IEFFIWASDHDIESVIISHKTQYPFVGPRCDLHQSARNWIRDKLSTAKGALLFEDRVYFETSKEAKLARVRQKQCDVFVDDLPEVLLETAFPGNVRRILFDPAGHHKKIDGLLVVTHWKDIRAHLEPRWTTPA